MRSSKLAALAFLLAAPLQAGTRPPAAPRPPATVVKADASIPFANHGGVDNWHAVNDGEVWFEDSRHHWYRARLMMPAIDLPFVEGLAIDSGPVGTLDRFGGIIVKGQTYRFAAFDQMSGPPPGVAPRKKR